MKEKVPKTLDEFLEIKYNDAEKWKTLKVQYRVVNQYKVDSGKFSVDEILDLDRAVISEKRKKFTSKYKTSGNIAGAYIDDDTGRMFFSHSLLSDSKKGYKGSDALAILKEHRRFTYTDITKKDGTTRINTCHDTEAKLFEYFADLYDKRPFAKISMLSERGMCDSCKSVMEQFKKLYPSVKVNVISNKRVEGDVWKHRWRRKS